MGAREAVKTSILGAVTVQLVVELETQQLPAGTAAQPRAAQPSSWPIDSVAARANPWFAAL